MQAISFDQPGAPSVLKLSECAEPEVGPGDVLIEVHATALNRADLLQRRGLYPPPAGASEILGLECAGIVSKNGSHAGAFQPGTRVMALLSGGGYAQKVSVPQGQLMPIPENLSFIEAAAMPEAFLTAQEALFNTARLEPREVVLIHAAGGGVGSAAVQLARRTGALVVATAGTEAKLARAKELGARVACNYKTDDFSQAVLDVSEGRGANVILDFVGAKHWDQHARCLAELGRHVVVGMLGGRQVGLDLARLLKNRQSIHGIVMRSRSALEKAAAARRFERDHLPGFGDGQLVPCVGTVLDLAQAAEAHAFMERNENIGKIVLRVPPLPSNQN